MNLLEVFFQKKVSSLVKEKSTEKQKEKETQTKCPICDAVLKPKVCPYICFECDHTCRTMKELEAHWEILDCRNYKIKQQDLYDLCFSGLRFGARE